MPGFYRIYAASRVVVTSPGAGASTYLAETTPVLLVDAVAQTATIALQSLTVSTGLSKIPRFVVLRCYLDITSIGAGPSTKVTLNLVGTGASSGLTITRETGMAQTPARQSEITLPCDAFGAIQYGASLVGGAGSTFNLSILRCASVFI